MNVPWGYTRRFLAQRWRCKPWEVDEAPIDEVYTELRLAQIEAECAPAPAVPDG